MRRSIVLIPVLLAVLVGLIASGRASGISASREAPHSPQPATNASVAVRWFEAFANGGDLAVADELVAADHVQHDVLVPAATDGPDGQRQMLLVLRTGFPDLRFAVEDVIADGNRVAVRWTARGTHHGEFSGLAASGSPVALPGTSIFRIEEGRIAETWVTYDSHWLLLQIDDPA